MSDRILQQLNKFKEFEPDHQWLESTKSQLVQKVKTDTLDSQTGWTYPWQVFLLSFEKRLMPMAGKLMALVLTVLVVGGTGLAAEAEYIPTKALYKVKQTLEKVELVLATSARQEAKIYLKHAKKRSDEALKIASSQAGNPQDRQKNLNTVVTKLKNDLSAAAATLDIVQQDQGNLAEAKDLAKEVTEKVQSTVATLNQVAETTAIKEVTEKVNDAISTSEAVESNAIQILASNQEPSEENWDANYLTYDQLKELVSQKLKRGEDRMIKTRFALAEYKNSLYSKKAMMNSGSAEATSSRALLSDEQIKRFEEDLNKAERTLAEARLLIDNHEFVKAVDKLKEASALVTEVEKVLTQAENPIKEEIKDSGTNENTENNLPSNELNSVQNNQPKL